MFGKKLKRNCYQERQLKYLNNYLIQVTLLRLPKISIYTFFQSWKNFGREEYPS